MISQDAVKGKKKSMCGGDLTKFTKNLIAPFPSVTVLTLQGAPIEYI
jgi:hypothetical protein